VASPISKEKSRKPRSRKARRNVRWGHMGGSCIGRNLPHQGSKEVAKKRDPGRRVCSENWPERGGDKLLRRGTSGIVGERGSAAKAESLLGSPLKTSYGRERGRERCYGKKARHTKGQRRRRKRNQRSQYDRSVPSSNVGKKEGVTEKRETQEMR